MRRFVLFILFVISAFSLGNSQCQQGIPVEEVEEENSFWFATIDSMEGRWGMHWSRSYETQAAFDAILSHDPPVDFVISTGDNMGCTDTAGYPTHPATAVHCFLELKAAMEYYLPDIKVYHVAANHDIGSTPKYYYNPPVLFNHEIWEEYIGPLDQEFTHKGAHFVLISDGDAQMTPFWELWVDRYNWYCSVITSQTLSFRHMVKVGYYVPNILARFPCEIGVVPYVFFGHYGENWQQEYNGTMYVETADANEGHVRFVHVVNGEVVEMTIQ